MPTDLQRSLARHRLTLLALVAITTVLTIYWQSFSRLIGMWSISGYEYGWLVYPISVYLLIRNRDRLLKLPLQTSIAGVSIAGLVVLAWIVARAAGVQVAEFAGATFLIFAFYWAVAGVTRQTVSKFLVSKS